MYWPGRAAHVGGDDALGVDPPDPEVVAVVHVEAAGAIDGQRLRAEQLGQGSGATVAAEAALAGAGDGGQHAGR